MNSESRRRAQSGAFLQNRVALRSRDIFYRTNMYPNRVVRYAEGEIFNEKIYLISFSRRKSRYVQLCECNFWQFAIVAIRSVIITARLAVVDRRECVERDERKKRRSPDSDFSLRRRRLSYPVALPYRGCKTGANRQRQEGDIVPAASRYNMVD